MGISGRIARFFQGSQLTPLLALVAFLLGLFAVAVTPREEEPQINVTMANVFVPFPGASAKRPATARSRCSPDCAPESASRSHPFAPASRRTSAATRDPDPWAFPGASRATSSSRG